MANLFDQPAPAAAPAGTTLKLLKLRLENFKGAKDLTLDLDGRDASLFGDNATFKTTCYDAFLWVLFGADSAGRKDFEVKTLGPDGEAAHGLEHSVEAALDVNGKTLVLRKTFKELWTKTRGSAERVFAGHTTDHYLDGVPVRKQDYDARIASLADEQAFKLLTNCAYFNEQLHWQKRRALLLEVCGDIDDEAVIASDPALSALTEILGGRKLADHKKVLAAARTKINKDLEQVPIRISEVNRGLPEVQDLGPKAEACLVAARATRQKKLEELALVESGGETGQRKKRLAEIESGILDLENRERRKADEALAMRRRALGDAAESVTCAERVLANMRSSLEDLEARVRRTEAGLETLRTEFRAASATTLAYTDETACPTCGQALPEEMVEAARDKALARFNDALAERLERLDAEGKELRGRRDQADAAATRLREEIAKGEAALADLREKADDAAEAVTVLEAARFDCSRDPDYRKLTTEHDNLTAALAAPQGAPDTTALRAEIATLESDVAAWERIISQTEQRAKGLARVEELAAEEKRLAAEYERLERELYLTEEFTRAKVRLLTQKINDRFTHARFKLFEVLVNGAVEECCQTTVGGVPYGTGLNHGARMNAGIEILNVLSEYYGFVAPVWVDNAESVTSILPSRGQMIKLVVSEIDKALRVKVARPAGDHQDPAERLREMQEEFALERLAENARIEREVQS